MHVLCPFMQLFTGHVFKRTPGERVCRCCAKGEHVRDTFPSLPPTSFPRGYSFAFNCERDWSQPCVSSLRALGGSARDEDVSRRLRPIPREIALDMPNVNSQFDNCSFVGFPRFAKDIKWIPMKNSANTPPIACLYYF